MAETIKICKHNTNGTGYCDILGGYCVEGPCSYEELAEYAPVRHGRWVEKEKYTFGTMYDCSICDNRILDTGHPWNYCPMPSSYPE